MLVIFKKERDFMFIIKEFDIIVVILIFFGEGVIGIVCIFGIDVLKIVLKIYCGKDLFVI